MHAVQPDELPLAAMPLKSLRPAVVLELAAGRRAGASFRRHLRVPQCRRRAIRRAAGRGDPRRTSRGMPMAALASRLLRLSANSPRVRPRRTTSRRSGEARGGRAGRFPRSFDSLQALVAFTAAFFDAPHVNPALLQTVDFALEELFTNMVKYSPDGAPRSMSASAPLREVSKWCSQIMMSGFFDVTRAPAVDVELPIEQRRPGGLGLHLIRRMLDSLEYQYSETERRSRIRFRKNAAEGPASGGRQRRSEGTPGCSRLTGRGTA